MRGPVPKMSWLAWLVAGRWLRELALLSAAGEGGRLRQRPPCEECPSGYLWGSVPVSGLLPALGFCETPLYLCCLPSAPRPRPARRPPVPFLSSSGHSVAGGCQPDFTPRSRTWGLVVGLCGGSSLARPVPGAYVSERVVCGSGSCRGAAQPLRREPKGSFAGHRERLLWSVEPGARKRLYRFS